jgi:aminopeptidase N
LGDEKFLAFLRELCNRYRFKTVSTEQFRELASQFAKRDVPDPSLRSFFDNWVYGTGIPTVKMTYAYKELKLTGTLTQSEVDDEFSTFVPVEVETAHEKTVHWLPTSNDPAPFSIPLKAPPLKVSLLASDWLITVPK